MPPAESGKPQRLKPTEVRYLALEGGGAKGIAFIGALAALDALDVRLISGARGSIRGVAGASAGSMTAFMYAMRLTTEELIAIQMAERAFTRFFEPPRLNEIRTVSGGGYVASHPMVRFVGPSHRPLPVFKEAVEVRARALANFPFDINSPAVLVNGIIHNIVRGKLRDAGKSNPDLAPLLNVITRSRDVFFQYSYSLLFDLGLFTGAEVRTFLKEQLANYIRSGSASERAYPIGSGDLDRLTVGQFAGMTNVEVAFAATNMSTGRGTYLRASPNSNQKLDTPQFPVVDAVAISSAYPFAFKPYAIFGRQDVANGYWLDGGVQNNFPLHAFDAAPDVPLAPGMLGIRLESSSQLFSEVISDLSNYVDPSVWAFLLSYVFGVLDTAMYPTEGGQIRTPQEQSQTVEIKIPADVLSTLAFAPQRRNAVSAILIAFDSVADYFVPGFRADTAPDARATAEEMALRRGRVRLRSQLAG